MRRSFTVLFSIWFAASSVFYPVTSHAATYNATKSAAGLYSVRARTSMGDVVSVAAAAASMAGRANPWITGVTVGIEVVKVALGPGGNFFLNPRDALPDPDEAPQPGVPASWSGYSAAFQSAGPLSSISADLCTKTIYPGGAPAAPGTACQAVETYSVSGCNRTASWCRTDAQGHGYYYTVAGTATVCPTGYTLTNGTCIVTNPAAALRAPDGKPSFRPSATGTWEPDPRDPDPVTPTTPTSPEITNAPFDYYGDQYGNPTSTSVTPRADGGFTIDQRVQTTNNNQTTTTINNVTINNNGTVTNVTSTTVPGGLTTASPTSAPVTSDIKFPDDYNREATQQEIKTGLANDRTQAETAANTLKDQATAAIPPADATRWTVEGLGLPHKSDFEVPAPDLHAALPTSNGECVTLDLPWVGNTLTLNPCPIVTAMRPIINWAVLVLGAIATIQFVLTRKEEN